MIQWMDKRDATQADRLHDQPLTLADYERTQKVLWGVFALSLFCGFIEYGRSADFEASSIETTGTVLDKWEGRRRNGGITPKHIRVRFVARDGAEHRYAEVTHNQAAWSKLSIGSQVPVWYVPGDPANHTLFERHR